MSDDVKAALITGSAIYITLLLAVPVALQMLDDNVGKRFANKKPKSPA